MTAGEASQAHIEAQRQLRLATATAIAAYWAAAGSHNDSDLPAWLGNVLPLIAGAQRQSIAITSAFFALTLGRQPRQMDTGALIGAGPRRGAPPTEVYRRPFVDGWTALKAGKSWEEAGRIGQDRAVNLAETDVQLTMRDTVAAITEADPDIHGYRRVADPGACALCRLASTQRYRRGDLLPIHPHCGCGVLPIYEPTGQVIDSDLLRQLKSAGDVADVTASRESADAREENPGLVVAVVDHGELGPVLWDASHSFDLAA